MLCHNPKVVIKCLPILFLTCQFIWLVGCASVVNQYRPAMIPALFSSSIPTQCQQVVLVQADDYHATQGSMWLLERTNSTAEWQTVFGPEKVSLGRKGLAWGTGLHASPAPENFPIKKEGDNKAPIGVFTLPFLFGEMPLEQAGAQRMLYRQMTVHHAGVDDPTSRYYNQVVDDRKVSQDWKNAESMLPKGGSYRRGIYVSNNPQNQPGLGSCIFMHLWVRPMEPTSGCTAMSDETMLKLFQSLDHQKYPLLVQTVKGL